ncbi:MAG: hypothetical protein ACU83V_12985 [Gammaproteobacteria bacterium]
MAHVHGKSMMKEMSNVKDSMGQEIMKGSMASVTVHTGAKLMSKLAKNPILVFSAGVVAGVLVYKYRKEIIASANKVVDSGKDFVLQQKENLEDIVAETKEES